MIKPWEIISLSSKKHSQLDVTSLDIDVNDFESKHRRCLPVITHSRIIRNNSELMMQRGGHFHLDKSELLICAMGKLKVELHSHKICSDIFLEAFDLTNQTALLIQSMTWHRIVLYPGTVLVAYANKKTADNIVHFPCTCKKAA